MKSKHNNDLKTRERYTASFDSELLKGIKSLSKDTEVPLSKLLDRAIKMLLESQES